MVFGWMGITGVTGSTLRRAAWLAGSVVLLLGCGGQAGDAPSPKPPMVPITTDCVAGAGGDCGRKAPCTEITLEEPTSWALPKLSQAERERADRLVDAAQKAVHDSGFRDLEAMVELARLQLWRDADKGKGDTDSDAERAHLNGMRAVAVDQAHPAARLVLALTIARSMIDAAAKREPQGRRHALGLVELAGEAALDGAPDSVAAAAHTLLGYARLDRGQLQLAARDFDQALGIDPRAVGAWVGRGYLAGNNNHLAGATSAYQQAAALLPRDPEVQLALEATGRCEGMSLHAGGAQLVSLPRLTQKPLAPPPGPASVCTAAELADQRNARLCQGRVALGQARTAAEQQAAAGQILAGWRDLRAACETGEPVCGGHVAAAMLEASQAFRAAGQMAKAIGVGKLLLMARYQAFKVASVQVQATLQVGDYYYALGVYDLAARHYELHGRAAAGAPTASAARERALAIRVAFAQTEPAKLLAKLLATDRRLPEARRAGAVLVVGKLLRSSQRPAAAAAWLEPHRALLEAAGRGAEATEIGVGPAAVGLQRAMLLPRAIHRLAADGRWSPAADRIADQVPEP